MGGRERQGTAVVMFSWSFLGRRGQNVYLLGDSTAPPGHVHGTLVPSASDAPASVEQTSLLTPVPKATARGPGLWALRKSQPDAHTLHTHLLLWCVADKRISRQTQLLALTLANAADTAADKENKIVQDMLSPNACEDAA